MKFTTQASNWTVDTEAKTVIREPIDPGAVHINLDYEVEPYTYEGMVFEEGHVYFLGPLLPGGWIRSGTVVTIDLTHHTSITPLDPS